MRTPTGYATIVDPDAPLFEWDTCTCGHCQRVIFTKPGTASTIYLIVDRTTLQWREEPGAFCRRCMRPVCLACHAHGGCRTWEKLLERSERRHAFLRSVGLDG
jgi:hypothetical protein